MRLLISSMIMCCCAAVGYSQETVDAPTEITSTDGSGDEVAIGTDSKKADKSTGGGCGCGGKPKM